MELAGRLPSVDLVVGVGRGGLVPAAMLCRVLGCERFLAVFARKYGEGKPPPRLYERPLVIWGFSERLSGEAVVVVDDIAVTGETLELVRRYALERGAWQGLYTSAG